jgi:hypothetical protein
MTATTYKFGVQLRQGEGYEAQLDTFFRNEGFRVSAVNREMQRQGIDRVFFREHDGKLFTVEYKADSLAGKTGNAFIETVSVDTANKPGWAYSSQATVLVYLVVEPETIYWLELTKLRKQLSRWEVAYPRRTAQNDGYQTYGLLVPLHELERIAEAVY